MLQYTDVTCLWEVYGTRCHVVESGIKTNLNKAIYWCQMFMRGVQYKIYIFFLKCLKCTVLNRGSYKNIIRNICASGNIQLL